MGKKKFIDKKHATTYTLVFRSTDEAENPESTAEGDRVLVPTGEATPGVATGIPRDPRALYAHFFGGEEEHEELTEARHRELLEYGFADDGYDYLKHCRVIGKGTSRMQVNQTAAGAGGAADPSAAGSSSSAAAAAAPQQQQPSQAIFLPAPRLRAPAADVKLVDARSISVAAAAAAAGKEAAVGTAAAAAAADPGLPAAAAAAALPVLPVASEAAAPAAARKLGGRELAAELAELEQLMEDVEADDADVAAGEDGLGDLLDDFVLTAAAAGAAAAAGEAVPAAATADDDDDEHETDEEEEEEAHDEDVPAPSAAAAAVSRPQQQQRPRSAAYDLLNEQFDSLMSAYDDEQLGDLEGDERTSGRMRPEQLAALVRQQQRQHQQQFASSGEEGEEDGEEFDSLDDDDDDDDVAGSQKPRGGQRKLGFKPPRAPGGVFEPKVESLAEKDEAVVAAVRARLAAVDAAAAAAGASSSGGGGSSSRAAAGGVLAGEQELRTVYVEERRERWDCESVLSLRSNVSHYPAKISAAAPPRRLGSSNAAAAAAAAGSSSGGGGLIKLNARTGLPSGYGAAANMAAAAAAATAAAVASGQQPQRLTPAALAAATAADGDENEYDGTDAHGGAAAAAAAEESVAPSLYERPKHESAEDRKARKGAVKAAQREARATKKALKQLYTSEAGRQQRQQVAAAKGAVFAIP